VNAPAAVATTGRSARTEALLKGPLLQTILRLATPNVLGLFASTGIIAYDGYIIGLLGTQALAGAALVFPLAMLMQQMSNGALGGSINSVVARALGSGDRALAERLAQHAIATALIMAAIFSLIVMGFGPSIYTSLGGSGENLQVALTYSTVLFAGGFTVWMTNTLAAIVRGSGNMAIPSFMLIGTAVLHAGLCPLLVFGWGAFAGLGIAGAAASTVAVNVLAASVMLAYLLRPHAAVRLHFRGAWSAMLFRTILRIGLPGAFSPLLSNSSILLATAYVGTYGVSALAGFGVAARLEFILIPIVFGIGTVLTTMVATNIGAGNPNRAIRATWTGALLVAIITGTIGVTVGVFPLLWMQWFTADPAIIAFGSAYLNIVGPCYGFFGVGLVLFFASQGSGKLGWVLIGSTTRLVFVAVAGWVAIHWLKTEPSAMFVIVAIGFTLYATINALSLYLGRWGYQKNQHLRSIS
jgi:putative MATE family efflux protein